jgi:phosphohistidine phosphatase
MTGEDKSKASRSSYELYIMRHGIAVARGTEGFSDDSKRPLSPEGKEKVRDIAKGLKRCGVKLDWIVSSPLVRAVETAEIVAATLNSNVPVDRSEALSPSGSPEALIAFLAKQPSRRSVLVAGHEPDLSDVAARLIGAGRHAGLALKKGGCCLITFQQFPPKAAGELVWWLTPRLMRRLG